MPSANKTAAAAAASAEGNDPAALVASIMEKKIRNFEKKRTKLLDLKQRKDEGKELDKDQLEALGRMHTTECLLDFAKELQKQFAQVAVEAQKVSKRKAHADRIVVEGQREKSQRDAIDTLLRLKATLDHLDEDNRHDFLNGINGARLVSQKEFEQIDDFLGKVNVSLDRDDIASCAVDEQVEEASHHIYLYLHRSKKEVVGTTYNDLRDLIESILSCDFFKPSTIREPSGEPSQRSQSEETQNRDVSADVELPSFQSSRLSPMVEASMATGGIPDEGLASPPPPPPSTLETPDEFDFFHQSEINPPSTEPPNVPATENESSQTKASESEFQQHQYQSSSSSRGGGSGYGGRPYRGRGGRGFRGRGGGYRNYDRDWNEQSRGGGGGYRGRGGRGGGGRGYYRGGNYRGGGGGSEYRGGEKRYRGGGGGEGSGRSE